jgi:aspartyl-tRNA synthetase
VCNGYEVGGGSLRANDPEMLRATYKIMGYSDEEIEASVGHILKAFSYGSPPTGGIAIGLDRLMMVLNGETSIKESVAFPTTKSGRVSVMSAPASLASEQLDELGLEVLETKE